MKVLMLDCSWAQSLFLAAEISAAGAEVHYISETPVADTGLNGICKVFRLSSLPDAGLLEAPLSDKLLGLLRKENYDLVIPLCEPMTEVLAHLPVPWRDKIFKPVKNEYSRAVLDKRLMQEIAAEIGILVPAILSASVADVSKAEEVAYPIVLKSASGFGGAGVRIIRNRKQLLAELMTVSGVQWFAQAYVAGEVVAVGALFERGKLVQYFSQAAVECDPPITGPMIVATSLPSAQLRACMEALGKRLGLNGLVCADFIRDEDGKFWFLELNARPWGSMGLALSSGIDFFKLFARLVVQGSVDAVEKKFTAGRRLVKFPHFLANRAASDRGVEWRDVPDMLRMFRSVSFRFPGIVLMQLKTVYWDWLKLRSMRAARETNGPMKLSDSGDVSS